MFNVLPIHIHRQTSSEADPGNPDAWVVQRSAAALVSGPNLLPALRLTEVSSALAEIALQLFGFTREITCTSTQPNPSYSAPPLPPNLAPRASPFNHGTQLRNRSLVAISFGLFAPTP